jgi:hypothetical protein
MTVKPSYPDLSELFAKKAKGRAALAALSFVEKLAILDELKEASNLLSASRKSSLIGVRH